MHPGSRSAHAHQFSTEAGSFSAVSCLLNCCSFSPQRLACARRSQTVSLSLQNVYVSFVLAWEALPRRAVWRLGLVSCVARVLRLENLVCECMLYARARTRGGADPRVWARSATRAVRACPSVPTILRALLNAGGFSLREQTRTNNMCFRQKFWLACCLSFFSIDSACKV